MKNRFDGKCPNEVDVLIKTSSLSLDVEKHPCLSIWGDLALKVILSVPLGNDDAERHGQHLLALLRFLACSSEELDVLMAQPDERLEDFEWNSAKYKACKRRDWYEKAKSLPVHYEARHHYLQLLQKDIQFYEHKEAERSEELLTAKKMEQRAKQAVQDAMRMACEQAKRTEEKIRRKKSLKELGKELRSPGAGAPIWSVFE